MIRFFYFLLGFQRRIWRGRTAFEELRFRSSANAGNCGLPPSANPMPLLRVEAGGREILCAEANHFAADLEIRAPALAR